MKKHDVVKFHTPFPDENPASRYLLLDDPAEVREHAARIDAAYPNLPKHPVRVEIEYLGKMENGKLIPTDMFIRPINSVGLADIIVDSDFKGTTPEMDEKFKGKTVIIKAPASKGGKYLGRDGKFEATREKAFRYDYDRHKVGEQITQLLKMAWLVEIELA